MKVKTKLKKKQDLYNALIKLGCCGQCAFDRKKDNKELRLFCTAENKRMNK